MTEKILKSIFFIMDHRWIMKNKSPCISLFRQHFTHVYMCYVINRGVLYQHRCFRRRNESARARSCSHKQTKTLHSTRVALRILCFQRAFYVTGIPVHYIRISRVFHHCVDIDRIGREILQNRFSSYVKIFKIVKYELYTYTTFHTNSPRPWFLYGGYYTIDRERPIIQLIKRIRPHSSVYT